jgi:DNA-binding response OmpR family regulator
MPRILVVEHDEPPMRMMVWSLRDAGFADVFAATPTEATMGAAARLPDIIILNVEAAAEDKRALVKALRRSAKKARIIDVAPKADGAAYNTSADGYLRPPYVAEQLVTAVRGLAEAA